MGDVAMIEREDVDLASRFQALRAAYARHRCPDRAERLGWLKALRAALVARQAELVAAIDADFGGRAAMETRAAEVLVVAHGIDAMIAGLPKWMAGEVRSLPWYLLPASGHVVRQPKGVIGVVAPWNYPFQLSMLPVAMALAAGNRVMLKPSEITPRTAAFLADLFSKVLPKGVVDVVEGGPDVGAAFVALPFDHLVFTGSTSLGRKVMAAAAPNLVPVTLELGGKSPVIVAPDASLEHAAERIAYGKMLNAGQTCVAPDTVLVPEAQVDAFVRCYREAVGRLYPRLLDNADYTAIVNDRHRARLQSMLEDARAKGAQVTTINPAGETAGATRRMLPTVILGVTDDMLVSQDEIFGPILPIIPVRDVDAAMDWVNARPRPLALYIFSGDRRVVDKVTQGTTAGGMCVNETMIHAIIDDLPFGGIGARGMGNYHGEDGFLTFTHRKSVLRQARLNGMGLFAPPFGPRMQRLLDLLVRP